MLCRDSAMLGKIKIGRIAQALESISSAHRSQRRAFLGCADLQPSGSYGQKIQSLVGKYTKEIRAGSFYKAALIRAELRTRLIERQEHSSYILLASIQAALEIGLSEWILQVARTKHCCSPITEEILRSIVLVAKRWSDLSRDSPKTRYMQSEIVYKRKALIVGPTMYSHEEMAELLSRSEMILTSDIGLASRLATNAADVRLYVNNYKARCRTLEIMEAAESVSSITVKSEHTRQAILSLIPHAHVKLCQNLDICLLGHYGSTQIPIMIHDVFMHGLGEISIIGADFYTSGASYRPDYKTNDLSKDAVLRQLRLHDPFPGYLFSSMLISMGVVKLSRACPPVMGNDELEYGQILDNIFLG